jgi:hypothetical protein
LKDNDGSVVGPVLHASISARTNAPQLAPWDVSEENPFGLDLAQLLEKSFKKVKVVLRGQVPCSTRTPFGAALILFSGMVVATERQESSPLITSFDGALAIVELSVRHVLEGFVPDAAESMQKAPPIIKFGPRAIRPKDAGATCDNCLPVVATTSRDLVARCRTVHLC